MQASTPPQPRPRGSDHPTSTCTTTTFRSASICARTCARPVVILVLLTSAVAKPPIFALHRPLHSGTPYPPSSTRIRRRASLLVRGAIHAARFDYLPCPQFVQAHLALQMRALGGYQPLLD